MMNGIDAASLTLWPGCSHLQYLTALQYANMEGEGLGDLVTCSYVR